MPPQLKALSNFNEITGQTGLLLCLDRNVSMWRRSIQAVWQDHCFVVVCG